MFPNIETLPASPLQMIALEEASRIFDFSAAPCSATVAGFLPLMQVKRAPIRIFSMRLVTLGLILVCCFAT
jgi:hypothetical protein